MAPQSYYLGGKIRATDFNGFANDINEIVGIGAGDSGYGQNQLVIPTVASGTKINASHMQLLLTALKFAGQHQGTTILSPDDSSDPGYPQSGNLIELIPNIETDIPNVRSNKLNFDLAMMTVNQNVISSTKTYVPSGQAGDVWDSNVTYEVSVIFTDSDARRHFFNTGGELRLDTTFVASYTDKQSLDWQALFSAVGMVKISHNITEVTGGTGTPGGGFTSLTTTYQKLYEKAGGGLYAGYYANNKYEIYARLNGNNAIDLRLDFLDTHVADTGNSYPSGPWTGQDYVAGTLTAQIDVQRADDQDISGNGVVIPSPTFSHISEL